MQVDHLIIGTENLQLSIDFYTNIFPLIVYESFIDTGTGEKGVVLINNKNESDLKIMLVPFEKSRLPNPQHIAFLVEKSQFNAIYDKALKLNLNIRSESFLNSTKKGIGNFNYNNINYENFYILDPSRVNIEILYKLHKEF